MHHCPQCPSPVCPRGAGTVEVHQGDNLAVLRRLARNSFDLIYVDPPFNTGHAQTRTRIKTVRDDSGDRVGFQGKRYRTRVVGSSSYVDSFDDYTAFLRPRLEEAFRLLKPSGSFFLHLDYREVHYLPEPNQHSDRLIVAASTSQSRLRDAPRPSSGGKLALLPPIQVQCACTSM